MATMKLVTKCQVEDCKSTKAAPRTYLAKGYEGPCGDSFCYHSCDSPACKEQHHTLCDKHYKELRKCT